MTGQEIESATVRSRSAGGGMWMSRSAWEHKLLFVQALFGTAAISPAAGTRVVLAGVSVLVLTEMENALRRR